MPPGSRASRAAPMTSQRLTGLQLSPHYGASKLRWCLDHLPAVRSAAAQSRLRAGPLAAILLHRLLEERPLLRRRVDRGTHPPLVALRRATGPQSSSNCSAFRAQCCRGRPAPRERSARLPERRVRVPVVVCNGDQSVVPFAAGPLDFDAAYVNLGTGAFVLRPTPEALHAPPLLTSVIRADAEHFDFVLEGSVNGAGRGARLAGAASGRGGGPPARPARQRRPRRRRRAVLPERRRGTRFAVLAARFRVAFVGEGSDTSAMPRRARKRRLPASRQTSTRWTATGPRLNASSRAAASPRIACSAACSPASPTSPVDRGSDREATSRGLAFLVAGAPAGFEATAGRAASSRSRTSACSRATSSGSR